MKYSVSVLPSLHKTGTDVFFFIVVNNPEVKARMAHLRNYLTAPQTDDIAKPRQITDQSFIY